MKNSIKLLVFFLVIVNFSCDNFDCDAGFEGENCDVLRNEQFFGTYTTTESECGSGNNSSSIDSIELLADPNGDAQNVNVIMTRSGSSDSGIGTLIDGTLEVTVVAGSVTSELSGTITGNTFTGTERASQGAVSVNCTITMDR